MRTETIRKILVLDAEPLALEFDFEKTFLERPEIALVFAPAGGDPVDAVRRECPDLVVLDLHAANRASLGTCEAIRSDPGTARIPVILLSTPTLRLEAERSGADAVVFKPLVRREFLEVVRRFLPLAERRSPRYPIHARFTFVHDGGEIQAFSLDLSETGVFLRAQRFPPAGAMLALRFRLPGDDGEIACDGVVRGARDPGRVAGGSVGFGVEFRGMEPADCARLSRFVGERLSRPVEFT